MSDRSTASAGILGVCLLLGFIALGLLLGNAAIDFKEFERSVAVKGLSEREFEADIVIWPVQFTAASNDLEDLYGVMERNTALIREFLEENGIDSSEVSAASPSITDKSAQQYGGGPQAEFRYTATQAVTVYSTNVSQVRSIQGALSQLGKQGIVFQGNTYEAQTEYLFTRLNEVKPEMIQEATENAREVALKFAEDSNSTLGKIKRASQGQFSISARDRNNPHIKKVRVVSTIEYYLSD